MHRKTLQAQHRAVEAAVQVYLKTHPVRSEYTDVLQAQTNRLQGSLVLVGYEKEGGSDPQMILQAALAIELFHAYILCMEQGVATTQALRTAHEAEIILANLDTDPENRLKALSITNRTLMLATLARRPETSPSDAVHWQATERALNPLHVGQVLAGADCQATNAVTPQGLELGALLVQNNAADYEKRVTDIRML